MKHTSNFTYRNLHIVNVLWSGKTMTSEELAILCGVSSKTIRSNMLVLQELLDGSGANLVTKKGQGYCIEVYNKENFDAFLLELYERTKTYMPDCPEERVIYLLFELMDGKRISRNDMMRKFVVNLATWNKHIKRLKNIFAAYRMELIIEKQDGDCIYSIQGTEFDWRLCILYRITWYGYGLIKDMGGNSREYIALREYLTSFFKENGIWVRKELFDDLSTSIYLSVLRTRSGKCCRGLSLSVDATLPLNGSYLRPVATELASWMSDVYRVYLNEEECLYIQLMLAAKTEYGDYIIGKNKSIPEEIRKLVYAFPEYLPEEMKDFLDNSRIRQYEIFFGIIPIYIRLYHGIYLSCPELRRNKELVQDAYQIALNMAPLFNQIGKIDLYEEELCLMAGMINYQRLVRNWYI